MILFLDQNIFKNISQIQLNENGPKVGPAPRVILVGFKINKFIKIEISEFIV